MESDVITIIPARSHPPPKRRLITRKTTIRSFVFRKHKSEATEENHEKSITKEDKQCKSPLKTNNSSDPKYKNNIKITSSNSISKPDLNVSKKKESSTKSSTKKKKTSRCNFTQLSENVENLSNVKTRSATKKLSQSFSTVKPSDLKPIEINVSNFQAQRKNASFMSLSSKSRNVFPENLRSSSQRVDGRISQSFSLAQNTAAPLSESEICSYSTDAILICRPANESNSELHEDLSESNVASHSIASSQMCTDQASFNKPSTPIVSLSSEKVIQTKSILKSPTKKDDKINDLACPKSLPDIPTPISKRKYSNPVNLSYQFKKLRNSDKNRSSSQKSQKGNKKIVSRSSQKKNTTKDWMEQSTVIEGNNVPMNGLGSHLLAAHMSNSINEKSLNCSAWKDGEVLPVLESTRYSLMPQLNKEDLNSSEVNSSMNIHVNKELGNLSKSVRWNTPITYHIVSPSPKVKRRVRRNPDKVKAVSRQKTASVLKEQKEIQSEENPSTSTSVELLKENSSHSSQKPNESQNRSSDSKMMILRKNPRKKKNVADVDVCLDTLFQETEKFRKGTENEDFPQIAGVFCEVVTEKIIEKTEDVKDSVPSKKNGKTNIKLEVLHKHEDLKRLKETIENQEIMQEKLKESAHRRKEINSFLYKLQDFHQRIMN